MKRFDWLGSQAGARRGRSGIGFCPHRRRVLTALTGSAAMAMMPARAQQNGPGGSSMYFVPGGRIGFRKPNGIDPWSNRWRLLSRDHTFSVEVSETIRISEEFDTPKWEKDHLTRRIATPLAIDGFELRRFRSLRNDPSLDYADEAIVLRDAHWMGEVQVSNKSFGPPYPGGQNARWRGTMEDIFGSIVVRPQPTIPDALSELGIGLDATGLHPRLVGERIILSLYPPRTALEVLGDGNAMINARSVTLIPPGATAAEREQHINEDFSISRKAPGSRVLASATGRGVLWKEWKNHTGGLATKLYAFGRTRKLEFGAYYDRRTRGAMLDALERVFQSLTLRDVS